MVTTSRIINSPIRTKPSYDDFPNEFKDPISYSLMIDPITISNPKGKDGEKCGHIFDRLALAKWFRTAEDITKPTCPYCRSKVTKDTPNEALKQKIEKWVKDNGFIQEFEKDKKTQLTEYKDFVGVRVIPKERLFPNEKLVINIRLTPKITRLTTYCLPWPLDCLQFGHLEKIKYLIFKKELNNAKNLIPTLSAFSHDQAYKLLIQAYVDENDLTSAKELVPLLDEFAQKDVYKFLIQTCIDANDLTSAKELVPLLDWFAQKDAYKFLIQTCIDANDLNSAKELIPFLNVWEQTNEYQSLLEECISANDFKTAFEIVPSLYWNEINDAYKSIIAEYIQSNGIQNIYSLKKSFNFSDSRIEFLMFENLKKDNSYTQIIKKLLKLNLSYLNIFDKFLVVFKFSLILSFSKTLDISKITILKLVSLLKTPLTLFIKINIILFKYLNIALNKLKPALKIVFTFFINFLKLSISLVAFSIECILFILQSIKKREI
jgi:hypothetical protein